MSSERPIPSDDADAVSSANEAFYVAFEERDFEAMSRTWEHSDRVTCVHPGWSQLNGWDEIAESWEAIFSGPQRLQFIVTDVRVEVRGDVAWVTCSENLIDSGAAHTVAATNVFVHDGTAWKLVHHHGSPVMQRRA